MSESGDAPFVVCGAGQLPAKQDVEEHGMTQLRMAMMVGTAILALVACESRSERTVSSGGSTTTAAPSAPGAASGSAAGSASGTAAGTSTSPSMGPGPTGATGGSAAGMRRGEGGGGISGGAAGTTGLSSEPSGAATTEPPKRQ